MKLFIFAVGLLVHLPMLSFAADAAAGKAKYDLFCVTCHGPAGTGDGPASTALNPKPKNLQATAKTDAELKKTIQEGGVAVGLSSLMPPWGASLTEADIDNVIAYIRSLKK